MNYAASVESATAPPLLNHVEDNLVFLKTAISHKKKKSEGWGNSRGIEEDKNDSEWILRGFHSYRNSPENTFFSIVTKVGVELCQDVLSKYQLRETGSGEFEWILVQSFSVLRLLLEIPSKIVSYFGPDTKLALRIYKDPAERNEVSVVVIVQTRKSVDDTLKSLDSFDVDWWLEASLSVDVAITVDTEYV